MKKTLTLLLLTTIAISACKKETPKKTPTEKLVGKKYKSIGSFSPPDSEHPVYTFLEFKAHNELVYYETDFNGVLKWEKTIKRWEQFGSNRDKLKLWLYPDVEYLTGDIKGDTIIANYKQHLFIKYLLVKD